MTRETEYPRSGRSRHSARKIVASSYAAIERSRRLNFTSQRMVRAALGKLPSKPDGVSTLSADVPGYLYHVLSVPGEPDIGILYSVAREEGRSVFRICNLH